MQRNVVYAKLKRTIPLLTNLNMLMRLSLILDLNVREIRCVLVLSNSLRTDSTSDKLIALLYPTLWCSFSVLARTCVCKTNRSGRIILGFFGINLHLICKRCVIIGVVIPGISSNGSIKKIAQPC